MRLIQKLLNLLLRKKAGDYFSKWVTIKNHLTDVTYYGQVHHCSTGGPIKQILLREVTVMYATDEPYFVDEVYLCFYPKDVSITIKKPL